MPQKVFTIDEVIERLDDIKIDYKHPSRSYKGTTFYKIYIDDDELFVKIEDEVIAGQINPLDYIDVAAINRRSKFPVSKRKYTNSTIGFQKHPLNDVTVTSKYFELVEKINTIVTDINSMVQTHTVENKKLDNPITRVHLKFDEKSMEPKFIARDGKTERLENGRKRYDPLLLDNEPVSAENIHLLTAKSKITGVVSFSYCKSKFTNSIVREFKDILVDLYSYVPSNISFDDVYI